MIKRIKTNWKQIILGSVIITQIGIIVLLASFLKISQITLQRYKDVVPVISTASVDEQRKEVIKLTNETRSKLSLHPLRENTKLTLSAQTKACDMVQKNYYDHIDPEGRTTWHFFTDAGYSYTSAAENLAQNYYADQHLIDDWMDSPTHKLNIVNPVYEDIGIGICGNYIVQHFGKRG